MGEVEPIARREEVAEAGQAACRGPDAAASAACERGGAGRAERVADDGHTGGRGTFSATSAGHRKPRVRDRGDPGRG